MNKKVESIKSIFSDLDSLSPEKLRGFTQEMIQYFMVLKERLLSNDSKERGEAILEALEMREAVEEEMEKLSQKMNMDPSQLQALAEKDQNPMFEEVRRDIEQIRSLLFSSKKKAKKTKLHFAS